MAEQNETTPFDYLKSDINGISLADAYKQGKRDGTRMVAEEIFDSVNELWKPKHHNLCYGIIEPHPDCICCKYQALKDKCLKGG